MLELAPYLVALLVLAAFIAGFVDAIAGGGGLITVPALLLAGVDPVTALATNKLQGSFGSGTATLAYARAGLVDLSSQGPGIAVALVFGAAGALLAHLVPVEGLRIAMPVILVAVALFFAFKPGLTDADRVRRLKPAAFTVLIVPPIALYDGLFGPGTGSFFMLGFVMLAGYGVTKATAHTKALNFASNLGSLAVFAFAGAILIKTGLLMALAQTAGAALGARVAMNRGARLIKPLLVVTCSAMAARLLWQVLG